MEEKGRGSDRLILASFKRNFKRVPLISDTSLFQPVPALLSHAATLSEAFPHSKKSAMSCSSRGNRENREGRRGEFRRGCGALSGCARARRVDNRYKEWLCESADFLGSIGRWEEHREMGELIRI